MSRDSFDLVSNKRKMTSFDSPEFDMNIQERIVRLKGLVGYQKDNDRDKEGKSGEEIIVLNHFVTTDIGFSIFRNYINDYFSKKFRSRF